MSYFSKGRHRAPTHTAKRIAALAVATTVGTLAPIGVAHADTLDAIMSCESGGKNIYNFMYKLNPSYYTASGYFQIVNSTWKAYGGLEFAPTAIQATYAQQRKVAERILADAGTTPWNYSKACWAGKTGAVVKVKVPVAKTPAAPKAAPKPVVKKATPAKAVPTKVSPTGATYTIKLGDTLSEIAVDHGVKGGYQALAAKNPTVIENVHLIFPGEQIKL